MMNSSSSSRNKACRCFRLFWIVMFASLASSNMALAQSKSGGQDLEQRLSGLRDQMTVVADSLSQRAPGTETLQQQQAITDELRLLVRQFSAGQQAGDQSGTPQKSPGSSQSGNDRGAGMAAEDLPDKSSADPNSDETDANLILNAWGQMPDEIQQNRDGDISPRFLPKYERLIREYYRRIAK